MRITIGIGTPKSNRIIERMAPPFIRYSLFSSNWQMIALLAADRARIAR
jgi:hypothetical protein